MEITDKDICMYEDKKIPEGTELCDALRCMVCRDGKWRVSWLSHFGF